MNEDLQSRLVLTVVFFIGLVCGFAAGVSL